MVEFINKKTGELIKAFSARKDKAGGKVYIRFTESGKEYTYNLDNIEIVKNKRIITPDEPKSDLPFTIYTFKKMCYKCHQLTDIITYIIFSDGSNDDVTYPWDINRLLKNQAIFAHLKDPSIEYYGLNVIGENEVYDNILMERFPDRIKPKYSSVTKTIYPMNICCHCGAQQGYFYVYRQVNEIIDSKEKIDILMP